MLELELLKEAVLDEVKFQRDEVKLIEFNPNGLKDASGYVFYNTSKWTLQRLHNMYLRNSFKGL